MLSRKPLPFGRHAGDGGCRTKESPGKFRLSSSSLRCCCMYAARLLPRTCGGAEQFRFRQLSCKEPPAPCHKKSTKASEMCFVQDSSELSPWGAGIPLKKIPPRKSHERPSSKQSVLPGDEMNACASCTAIKIKRKAPRRSPATPKYRVHQHQMLTEPRLRIQKRHTFPVQTVFFNLFFKEVQKRRPPVMHQGNCLLLVFSASLAHAKPISLRALKKISFPQPGNSHFFQLFSFRRDNTKTRLIILLFGLFAKYKTAGATGATGQGAIMAASCACLSCACLSRLAEVAVRNCPRQVSFNE